MVLLVGEYGPNYDDSQFYYSLSARLAQWTGVLQLQGGDFNCVLCPESDRCRGLRGITLPKHVGVHSSIRNRLAQLDLELAELEWQHMETEERHLLASIKTKIDECHKVSQSEVNHLGKYAVARVYGEGERPGATLAALLQPF
ncbi:hypothetical protein NDU88_005032 [Pleurodeles waltl]|uniref:Uncharacterized protein n=1 Tax=Pleurodeles waltl TaxID=8319 RepID=A0AAV7MZ96_PLEWA|nr:hypothetical protein NDU88_005032 [Pleurodeles waltl]